MATAAKNRLLRMSHPDRARQHQEALWQLRNEATAHINALWQDIKPLLLAPAQQRASPPAQAQGAQRHAAAAAALEVVAENADACLGVVSTGGQGSGSSIKVLQSHTHTLTHTHTHTHTHTLSLSHSLTHSLTLTGAAVTCLKGRAAAQSLSQHLHWLRRVSEHERLHFHTPRHQPRRQPGTILFPEKSHL